MSSSSSPSSSSSSSSSFNLRLQSLLPKTVDVDKDIRWVAYSDICNELEAHEFNIDPHIQSSLSKSLLSALEEVESISVRALSLLVRRLHVDLVISLVESLLSNMANKEKETHRDIYVIGIKTIIGGISPNTTDPSIADVIVTSIVSHSLMKIHQIEKFDIFTPKVKVKGSKRTPEETAAMNSLSCVTDEQRAEMLSSLLESLREAIQRGGTMPSVVALHEEILKTLLTHLTSNHPNQSNSPSVTMLSKRVLSVFNVFVPFLSDRLFAILMENIFTNMTPNASSSPSSSPNDLHSVFTALQTISTISQAGGARIGKSVHRIMPFLLEFSKIQGGRGTADALTLANNSNQLELWENCLSAFEGLILNCPVEITPHVKVIIDTALNFIQFDPNYSYDADAQGEGEGGKKSIPKDKENQMRDEGGEGEGEGGGWGDDDFNGRSGGGDGWDDEDGDPSSFHLDENDDDDNSWKVRRGAVRVLSAVIRMKSDFLNEFYEILSDALIDRLKERDGNVKISIFQCTQQILREAVQIRRETQEGKGKSQNENEMSDGNPPPPPLIRSRSSYDVMISKVPAIMAKSLLEVNSPRCSLETRLAVFSLWRELTTVLRGGMSSYVNQIFPPVFQSLERDEMKARGEILPFLRDFIEFHTAPSHRPNPSERNFFLQALAHHLPSIIHCGISSVGLSYVRVKIDGMRLLSSVVENILIFSENSHRQWAAEIFQCLFTQCQLTDLDQEAKEGALLALAALLAKFGSEEGGLSRHFPSVFPILLSRLWNELTRISALRSVCRLCRSPLNIPLTPILPSLLDAVISFIHKESSTLRHEAVLMGIALVESSNGPMISPPDVLFRLVGESASIVSDGDLHLANRALQMVSSVIRLLNAHSDSPIALRKAEGISLLQKIGIFMRSPLLPGSPAMAAVIEVFTQILYNAKGQAEGQQEKDSFGSFPSLLDFLLRLDNSPPSVISECVAALALHSGPSDVDGTVRKFISLCKEGNESLHQLSLLIIGAIGRERDLSSFSPQVESIVLDSFDSPKDSVRNSASFALGNLSVGNSEIFLKSILLPKIQKIHSDGTAEEKKKNENSADPSVSIGLFHNKKFLLLAALRETIQRFAVSKDTEKTNRLTPLISSILPLLLENSKDSVEEGIRSITAECLGGLSVVSPAAVFPAIIHIVQNEKSPACRSVMISSLKYAFAHPEISSAHSLMDAVRCLFDVLKDKDLSVHRQALLTLAVLCHSHFSLVADELKSTVLPIVYADVQPQPSLVRFVDLGPFKHKIDDGLPIRRAAYQVIDTLIHHEEAHHRIRLDISQTVRAMQCGFTDHEDIQILSYQMVERIAEIQPKGLLEVLEDLPPNLMTGIKEQLKEAKGEANAERALDVLRAAVRCIERIVGIQGIQQCPKFVEFYQRVLKTPLLNKILSEMHNKQG